MRLYGVRPVFVRHPLKSFLIGVGVLGGLAVAVMGIALLLALLVAGGAVAWIYRLVRNSAAGTARSTEEGVIEGEFQVVPQTGKDYPRQLGLDGPARG